MPSSSSCASFTASQQVLDAEPQQNDDTHGQTAHQSAEMDPATKTQLERCPFFGQRQHGAMLCCARACSALYTSAVDKWHRRCLVGLRLSLLESHTACCCSPYSKALWNANRALTDLTADMHLALQMRCYCPLTSATARRLLIDQSCQSGQWRPGGCIRAH